MEHRTPYISYFVWQRQLLPYMSAINPSACQNESAGTSTPRQRYSPRNKSHDSGIIRSRKLGLAFAILRSPHDRWE
ncbi:uncharacterized protein N7473_001658 [Penicillium subrubescens]|uniref:uncharacterized protein n=1 Tax=Penicillium subrubescens TaxID=1316194 RepID=UPI0025454766|nr:uncharacterized protein N7473_001658 [Penicillium subrubescens]KAJ5904742.1 hypothetical protein N7473_001658 [Penicillium subrubescens]